MEIDKVKMFLDKMDVRNFKTIPKPSIILYKGNRISLKKGKSVWPSKGAARSAFTNTINHLVNYTGAKEVREELEKEGILEFREL